MARKDSPYLPLYVQDFITDEKLMECSASATGVYVRIMCVLHKSIPYGKLLLKQKDKQTDKQINNFANKLAKHFPYDFKVVLDGLEELINEGVLQIEGDFLLQKRMVNDGILSSIRSESGRNGVKAKMDFAKAKYKAKYQANSDIDIDIDIEDINNNKSNKFWFLKFFHSDYENYKKIFNGQSTTEDMFFEWKEFVQFIYDKDFIELFECKFLSPQDYAKLVSDYNFTKDKWEIVSKAILSTGVKPEHNLFFRIPKFMEYEEKTIGNIIPEKVKKTEKELIDEMNKWLNED